jgi:hypothetical protein
MGDILRNLLFYGSHDCWAWELAYRRGIRMRESLASFLGNDFALHTHGIPSVLQSLFIFIP